MSEAEKKVAEGELITGNYTLQAQLGSAGKTLTVSGYIYAHNTVESINKQIDTMHDVLDRQRTRAEIPDLEAKLEQRYTQVENMRDALAGLQAKQDAGKKLSEMEKNQIAQMNIGINKTLADIELGKLAIHDAKAGLSK